MSLPTVEDSGQRLPANEALYRAADRLDAFGFSDWIGLDPNGPTKSETGLLRDAITAQQTVQRLHQRQEDCKAGDTRPWPATRLPRPTTRPGAERGTSITAPSNRNSTNKKRCVAARVSGKTAS
ncbi:hypothetical protein [Acanthopleuribacter pedis]|uniref:Uncharacterized protein n=1 Tax=Acanthopleuribacter pedis TaxID=442870 RepID=A0A8J7Q9W2_9BACT|nr:hypothetical protein [Acanthopleuribacter pedis]MBO1321406.1 hypothetical protein [Acanthopleuribacter pedis]